MGKTEEMSFDFEGTVQREEGHRAEGENPSGKRRRRYKEIVCRLWLRNECPFDDSLCDFLHCLEESKMPICSYFARYGECRRQNCIYKHQLEDTRECFSYNNGFCPNGSWCHFIHKKLPGPAPLVTKVASKLRRIEEAKIKSNVSENDGCTQVDHRRGNFYAPRQLQGITRYFIIKSDNMENLQFSIERGMWATTQRNEDFLNDSFGTSDNVILIFSVNGSGHFQGCAKMKNFIGAIKGRMEVEWNGRDGKPKILGKNFYLHWIKTCELSFQKTKHLRNPYNENYPVHISRDCQEVEPSVGYQLVSLVLQQPNHPCLLIKNDNIDWDMEIYEYVIYGL